MSKPQFITADPDENGLPITAGVQFRTIMRFPGYAFGSDGSVWNRWKRGGCVRVIGHQWRRLKASPTGYKRLYREVSIRSITDPKRSKYEVQRLILEAFVGPCPEGMEACHWNGKHADNRLENLRWGTPVENTADKFRHGTVAHGEQMPQAKLSPGEISQSRLDHANGESVRDIAARIGVSERTLRRALKGQTWKRAG